ncbi:dTDP-4-dehydrorhamnose 3,5-epimerase family protein [Streptomyces sp. NBC_00433]
MDVVETRVPGAFVFTPKQIPDERGVFFEALRCDQVEEVTGLPFRPEQINYSASRRNTLRGIHGVAVPPGQAKYVTCVRGALRDVVVDLRVGSPTFGEHHVSLLDAGSGRCVYVPEGVGHGFLTLTEDACICYVVSTRYVPGTQIDINPLDADLALPWGFTEPPLVSKKDAQAQSMREALAAGVLAHWPGAVLESTEGRH